MSRSRFDKHYDKYDEGPAEKQMFKVMIPIHKVWAFFKKKKKKHVRRKI